MSIISKIKKLNDDTLKKVYGEERFEKLQKYQREKLEESHKGYKEFKKEMNVIKKEMGQSVSSSIQTIKSTRGKGKYLTGHPLINKPRDVVIRSNENGISLVWTELLKDKSVVIPWKAINKITSETKGELKKRASFGKAAVGLALLGPIGALIGAGMGTTDDNRSMFLTIKFTDETGSENDIIIESKKAHQMSAQLTAERYNYLIKK
jgi:hypothetical protein